MLCYLCILVCTKDDNFSSPYIIVHKTTSYDIIIIWKSKIKPIYLCVDLFVCRTLTWRLRSETQNMQNKLIIHNYNNIHFM